MGTFVGLFSDTVVIFVERSKCLMCSVLNVEQLRIKPQKETLGLSVVEMFPVAFFCDMYHKHYYNKPLL